MLDEDCCDMSDEELLASGKLSSAKQEVLRSKIELRTNYGVAEFEYPATCPVCERKNTIRRPSDNMCMACILRERNEAKRLVIRD